MLPPETQSQTANRSKREPIRLTFHVLLMCSGYYSFTEAHARQFPGADRFGGQILHPQFWPEALDDEGKRVVVLGSGATAVTLVPAMAGRAAHVVMLQRSPSYIVSRPSIDRIGQALRRILPHGLAGRLTRAKNIAESLFYYKLARARPEAQIGPGLRLCLPPAELHAPPRLRPLRTRT